MAKLEIINPIAVLLTPNDEAKIGNAGLIRPKPPATKKEIEDSQYNKSSQIKTYKVFQF